MAKPTKREISWANRAINEQLDLISDIVRQDGRVEGTKNAMYHDTVRRMSQAIRTLKLAGEPMPGRLASNWSQARIFGWHNDLVLPMARG